MGLVELILVILLIAFLLGGLGYPRAADGPAAVNSLLWVLAVVVLVVLVVRLLAVI